jgi:hypothetical protein
MSASISRTTPRTSIWPAFRSIASARAAKLVPRARVLVDSGAFTEISTHGQYRHGVEAYAADLTRLHDQGVVQIAAAVAQDYMCEPFIVTRTGLSVADHQRLTIERYDALLGALADRPGLPIMPVLQGYAPADYAAHVRAYGSRLEPGMWVGVGSVCKRNSKPERIVDVLSAIRGVRPDLRLHGFGVKVTALRHPGVRAVLATADSMAWSYRARIEGRDGNDWREAKIFAETIAADVAAPPAPYQIPLAI